MVAGAIVALMAVVKVDYPMVDWRYALAVVVKVDYPMVD